MHHPQQGHDLSDPAQYLHAALAYAALGWKVFPIDAGTKRPLTRGGFHDATCDEAQVRAWWTAVPEAWVAVWCRGSGFIAIDADGEAGLALRAQLERDRGPLPRICHQKTRNGEHVLVRDPSPGPEGWTRNRSEGGELRGNVGGAGVIDVKCNGYILVEPSGGRYKWLALAPEAMPEMPESWQTLLRRGADAPKIPIAPVTGELAERVERCRTALRAHLESPFGLAACAEASAEKRRKRARAVLDGTALQEEVRTGHMIVNELGIMLARVAPDVGDDAAWEVLRDCVVASRCQSDLPALESRARDGYVYGASHAVTAAGPTADTVAQPDDEGAEPVPAAPVDGFVVPDLTAADLAAMENPAAAAIGEVLLGERVDAAFMVLLDRAAEALGPALKTAEAGQKVVARRFAYSKRELRARNAPPPKYLVKYLVPEEGVGALSGEPKSGKSWDATHLAVAVAAGVTVFGRFAVEKPAGVFYFFAEDPESSVNNRTDAIAKGLGVDADGPWIDRLYAQPRGAALNVCNDVHLCILVASVWAAQAEAGIDFKLVVLDPLSNIHDGEEDSRDSMAPVMARLHAVEKILGAAVLFVHHSGKTTADKTRKRGGQKMRGSSAIHGAVDFGIYVSDTRGDGKTEFTAAIESEVKSAAQGGTFDRTIKIQDNADGNAVSARWTTEEREAESTAEDLETERTWAILKELFARQAPMSAGDLRGKVTGKLEVVRALLEGLRREGLVIQHMVGQQSRGWVLTDKGRQEVRADGTPPGSTPPADPEPGTPSNPSPAAGGLLSGLLAGTVLYP